MSTRRERTLVVVAHPDDEVLWCGGTILSEPTRSWRIVTVCRASDPDRAPRFHRALECLGADGAMGDLDDGPDQAPLDVDEVADEISRLAGPGPFDAVMTHGPNGEYTRHRRHEEVCAAVVRLWTSGRLPTSEMMLFAYEDQGGARPPTAMDDADIVVELSGDVWREKLRLVREVYGFAPGSWEHEATPRAEAFWRFESEEALLEW